MSPEVDIASIPCCVENFEPLFKLGLCYDAKKKIEESIKCYQKSIRIKDDDRRLWQCLGQAYFNRGSYINANKCFVKAIQLRQTDGNDYFEELRIGEIKTLLGSYDEAITIYRQILEESPDNVLALIGMAKINLILTSENFEKGDKEAFKLAENVFVNARKISSLRSDLIMPYNLIANCCILILQNLGKDEKFELFGKDYTGLELLDLAKRHILKALSLKSYSYLWYHLFIIYSLLYTETESTDCLQKSYMCLAKCKNK